MTDRRKRTVSDKSDAVVAKTQASPDTAGTRVSFKSEGIKSSYVNFANVNSTREEVVFNFGVNQDWDRSRKELEIELSHRLIMSPFAAKRLATMLQKLLGEYEQRYGVLK
jgi:hypothetical protein